MAQTRAFHRDALLPKPSSRTPFVPVIPHQDAGLARLLGDLVPEERRTLAEIVDRSDLLMVDGKPWLLVEATPGLVERLATFQAATEDLEPDLEDEGETDDDRDNDNPADQNGLREDLEDDDPGGDEHDGREPDYRDYSLPTPAAYASHNWAPDGSGPVKRRDDSADRGE